jgi:hypothetical protein
MTRLSIYTSHDRTLIFDGDVDDARIALHPETREVSIDGKRRKVLNSGTQPGWLGLWVTS